MVTFRCGPQGDMPVFEVGGGRLIETVPILNCKSKTATELGEIATRTIYIADDSGNYPVVPVVEPRDSMYRNLPA